VRRRGPIAFALTVTVAVAVAAAAAAPPAAACRCAQQPLAAYFAAADLVLVGRAVETWIDPADQLRRRVRFDSPVVYKGDAGTVSGFATPVHSASCGAAIAVGRQYVVFATRRPEGDGLAWFDTCGGTRAIAAGTDDGASGFTDVAAADVLPRLSALRATANADPRTSATPALPRPGDPRAVLIGLLELPGVLPAGEGATPAPPRPLRVYRRPAADAPLLTTVRAADQLQRREYAYEAPGAVVRQRRDGWYRIALAGGDDGWIRAADAGRFLALPELLVARLTYLGPYWDGWVWPDPGAGYPQAPRRLAGREQPVRVLATERIGDALWLQVEVLDRDPCDGGDARVVHGGWVPAYTAAGELVAWFHSRGC
jgi:hypothetical protein